MSPILRPQVHPSRERTTCRPRSIIPVGSATARRPHATGGIRDRPLARWSWCGLRVGVRLGFLLRTGVLGTGRRRWMRRHPPDPSDRLPYSHDSSDLQTPRCRQWLTPHSPSSRSGSCQPSLFILPPPPLRNPTPGKAATSQTWDAASEGSDSSCGVLRARDNPCPHCERAQPDEHGYAEPHYEDRD